MTKRVTITTIAGLITGIICWQLAASGGNALSDVLIISIILSRTLTGFVIGISALKLKWWLHGALLGGVFSVPMGLGVFMSGSPKQMMIFWMTIIAGIIYGVLIELAATVIFKAPNRK